MADVLKHPDHLFSDEAAVQHQFGMGCFLSPEVQGFHGIFRQRWQDFHVTEMVHDDAPLSRTRDYTAPSIPRWICGSPFAEEDVAKTLDDAPPADFFTVNVAEQLERNEWPGHQVLPTASCSASQQQSAKTSKNVIEPWQDNNEKQCRRGSEFYLQATLHKQHVSHPVAVNLLSKTLRIHPEAVSFAGIKDFIGDTCSECACRTCHPALH